MSDHVQLGDDHERFVAAAVADGRFDSRDALLREGVRLVREREKARDQFVAELRKRIAQADRGELIPLEEAFDQLRRHVRLSAEGRGRKDAA